MLMHLAFCSGGDQRIRGNEGYVGADGIPRLNVLDLQKQIRSLPKPVIAMVAGYAIGGGHVLHIICDLTIAADNARFGQVGPKVGSFDGGLGSSYLARIVGQKKAREIWFLCRQYDAKEALAAVEQYRDAGFVGNVYFMPVGGVESVYHLNNRTVADLAMKNGVRYSDRLQVPLFKNAWAT